MPAFQGVWLINRSLNDVPHRVPDDPGVIRSMEARGWQVTDLPTELDSDDPDFIDALESLLAKKEPAEAKSATKKEGSK